MPSVDKSSGFDQNITHGPLARALWNIAWPTLMLNIFGGVQGIVDHVCVGRFGGYQANAGVGAGWQIFAFFMVFITSIYGGVAVLVARFAGADEPGRVHRTFTLAFLLSVFFSLAIFAPLGFACAPWMLTLIRANAEVQAVALPYLRTLLLGNSGLVLLFLIAAALRAAGDARGPMRLTFLMTGINLVSTPALVGGLGPIPPLGAQGAAISTVGSGMLAAAVAIVQLLRGRFVVRFTRAALSRSAGEILAQIFRFGLPMGIQGLAVHLAGLVLLGFIGSLELSAEAQAAYSVAYAQVFMLINLVAIAMMAAVATVVGQNLGAGHLRRAARAPRTASVIALMINLPLAVLFFSVPELLLGLFGLEDPRVLTFGAELLRILSISSVFLSTSLIYIGALQGAGDTKSALIITLIAQVAVPVTLCALLQGSGHLTSMGIWLAIATGHTLRFLLAILRFRQGQWRTLSIHVSEDPNGNNTM